jgi:hypothetical protein
LPVDAYSATLLGGNLAALCIQREHAAHYGGFHLGGPVSGPGPKLLPRSTPIVEFFVG